MCKLHLSTLKYTGVHRFVDLSNRKNGFGHLKGEYWLGLDKIHRLTQAQRNKLRVDLEDTKGEAKCSFTKDYLAKMTEIMIQ